MIHAASPSCCWFMEQISDFDAYIHGATSILYARRTKYQQMYIAESPTMGKMLILDNKVQSTIADEFLYHESLVHPACLAFGSPQRVLVLGGGEGATIREVLRWKTVEQVVMVDIDREVVEACREILPEMHSGAFMDARAEVVFADAMNFLESNPGKWDVIISDITEPIEGGPSSKLFAKEFFSQVQERLATGGVFVLQAGPVGPQYIEMYSRLASIIGGLFPQILTYSTSIPSFPAPWGFIVGSTRPLSSSPQPETINEILADKTSGGFCMLDGEALLGLMQTPLYFRKSINRALSAEIPW